ncbi:MAG: hypothetical protein PUC82_00675 [bacterium]|nr:hypothetical protein [bacterium]
MEKDTKEFNENELENIMGGVPYEYGYDKSSKLVGKTSEDELTLDDMTKVIGGIPYEYAANMASENSELYRDEQITALNQEANQTSEKGRSR